MVTSPPTLQSSLTDAAQRWPDAPLAFPADGEQTSLAQFERATRCVASWLHEYGVERGDFVGLLCPNSQAFLLTLFAALHLGAVPVALPLPPSVNEYPLYLSRLAHILDDLGEVTVVVHPRFADIALTNKPHLSVLRWNDAWKDGPRYVVPQASPGELAFIQYTSGSTDAPKGVALSHGNLLAGVAAIADGMQLCARDRASIWLPLFHDMGFVGTLTGLLCGTALYIWTPNAFLRRPERWLRHFAAERCTVSLGPNFSFDYLVDGVDEADCVGLDLSAWRVAFNGGEQVEANTLERFSARFGPHGFRSSAQFPVYGLAEATLACTFPALHSEPVWARFASDSLARGQQVRSLAPDAQGGRRLVAVGAAVLGHEVRITSPDGCTSPDAHVGQIRVRGPAVMMNYHGNPEATRHTMDGEWLITGDLGFFLQDQLFVCGREKEMIIVRGRNFYPFDAEAVVRDLRGVHRQRCNAVALRGGEEERIGVFIEVEDACRDGLALLGEEAVEAVRTRLDLTAFEIHLVKRGTLKRTSSGKYRRTSLAEEHQRGNLHCDILASFEP